MNNTSDNKCGSGADKAASCPVPNPLEWPPMLQIPEPHYRAVRTDFVKFSDLPNESCRRNGSCPATVLLTGNNHSLGQILSQNMFVSTFNVNSSDILASDVIGSEVPLDRLPDPAFSAQPPIYRFQSQCTPNSAIPVPIRFPSINDTHELKCVQGLTLRRNSSSEINDELYKGYRKGNPEGKINEIVAAYDFLNSDVNHFNVSIWYNSTYKDATGNGPTILAIVILVMEKLVMVDRFRMSLCNKSWQQCFHDNK
ncbi:hypothetical protein Dsin_026535 [Dipteronia sinensis]|uniref:Uncharacterized protein n=1 Tax=Dipteronia sinensis TaxID=43782 RepID=A0AAE0DXX0_9ROSI|nr:hypothetical protein Dsin_026535 [Dipteronia sinensis]